MRGIYFDGRQSVLRSDLPMPTPSPGEALVKVLKAGVCKTDLEIVKGYMGFTGVMGHEFVGVVEQGPGDWPGRRVVGEINCPCGRCEMCSRGLGNHCPTRTVLGIVGRDGAFAEYLVLPVANLYALPDNVSDDQAVFAEPLAAAFEILAQVEINSDDKIAVLGDGRLGLLCAMVLAGRCENVLLVGKHAEKLAIAEKQGLATTLADAFKADKSYDVVVEATGSPSGFDAAVRAVRPRGIIVLKSTFAAEGGMNLAPLVIDEITVVGSRCGPFDQAVEALAAEAFDLSDMISARFDLSEGLAALQAAGQGSENIKVVLDVN